MTDRAFCMLVSRPVAEAAATLLSESCAQEGLRAELLVHDVDHPLDARDLERVEAALLSVDIIGESSKTALDPNLSAFVAALAAAPSLKWLQVCSAGMDRPFYADLAARGVRLSSGAGTNATAVAQTAVTGVLALARDLPRWQAAQRAHRWQPLRGELTPRALDGQHALVVGMGEIGVQIARTLVALGVEVTGLTRTARAAPFEGRLTVYGELDALLPGADWLILACPLTDDTRHLVDARRLALLKPGARVVNVARGEVIDEPALIAALRAGTLAGAHLDVFAVEPLAEESPLWDLPNVLISAHSAGNSTGHQRNVTALFARNMARYARGQPLINEWRPPRAT
ncbi:D-2-hydroxyacid dehydrogenase [Bordetella genomosp. 13]|uniref:D-2-hydroxyacid dehydrogenase n=1 Tax=Bordetella genomosp. 13 TaxID=463040 RepID=UPI00119DB562|nr:D-2-hydroxyacid dehydrogenase [Bordetella genomosp. 13]